MAPVITPVRSFTNINTSMRSLRSGLGGIKTKTIKLNNILLKKTKVKRESIARNYILSQRRQESERRKNREDLIEASSIGGVFKRQAKAIASSTKGFLGRIMDFLGTLLIGWLAYNLPSIITMAQELIARMQRLSTIVSGFFNNTVSIFRGFGNVLGAISKNILTFDFTDSNKRVENAMKDLNTNFDDMQSQFDEGFRLLTTSLGEGIVSGENAKPSGTQYPNDSMQPTPTPSGGGGGGGGGGGKWKSILDLISKAESSGGSYDSRYGGIYPGYSKLTIAEADKVQRENYKKWGSGASGRYQFMNIMGQATYARLKPTDLFSPENQDKMAIALIEKKKKITIDMVKNNPKEAQLRLAQEWAGIPTSNGASFYPPPNYATVKNADVQKAFSQIGSPQTSTPAQTSSAPTARTGVVDQFNGKPGGSAGQITGGFGDQRRGHRHAGIDIAPAGRGYYVAFKQSGTVTYAQFNSGGYGNLVIIKSGNTEYYFAHLAKIFVKNGQKYNGETIGEIGSTGESSGIHLHFEVRPNGKPIDPRPYLGLLSIGKGTQAITGAPLALAQIASPTTTTPQQLSQQRNGPTIVVIEEDPPAQQQVSSGGGGGGMIPIIINPLNSFITKKLLLDLAYT